MSSIVLLDAGPLGLITNPKSSLEGESCKQWFFGIVDRGAEIVIPEIADYEVRRELIRAGRTNGLARLDRMKDAFSYAPINTNVMLRAAGFWAAARRSGRQSASDASLDADMILAAQAVEMNRDGAESVVATTNFRHLVSFCAAQHWKLITTT